MVLCDNTLGAPGLEIDDGLALLYLLGCTPAPKIAAIICTHGNADTATTFQATKTLVAELGLDIPVVVGSERSGVHASAQASTQASGLIARFVHTAQRPALLSLGATTELATVEQLHPGTLANYERICCMGGITKTLVVGRKVMDELNFSVDGAASFAFFSAAEATKANSARIEIADAHSCLPLTFDAQKFLARLSCVGDKSRRLLSAYCTPWFEHARVAWSIHGFVGWDVLAAVALVHPEYVRFEPANVALNPRNFATGRLELVCPEDRTTIPCACVNLVRIEDPRALSEHIYRCWTRALMRYEHT